MAVLGNLLSRRRTLTLLTLCSSVLTAAVTLWWNAQLAGIIDSVAAGILPTQTTILRALAVMLAMASVNFGKGFLSGVTCETLTHDLRMGYARFFASLPFAEVEKLNAGEQLSRLQNEISGVSAYMNANLFQLFDDAVRFLSTFAWLLTLHPTLTLATNLPAFLLVAYILWSSRIIGAATELSLAAKAEMNRRADTLLALFPVIKLYDAARMAVDGYRGAVGDWERHTVRAERTKARLMSLSALLSSLPLLLLFLVGGHMAIRGALSVGLLYIFLNLSGNVSGVLMNMPGHIAALRQFMANMKRLSPHVLLPAKGGQR